MHRTIPITNLLVCAILQLSANSVRAQNTRAELERDVQIKEVLRQQLTEDIQARLLKVRVLTESGQIDKATYALSLAETAARLADGLDAETQTKLRQEIQIERDAIRDRPKGNPVDDRKINSPDLDLNGDIVDTIKGKILRSKEKLAEFNLNIGHGLYIGDSVDLVREDVTINTLVVNLIDTQQAVGISRENAPAHQRPRPGDEVIFHRKRPSVDPDHPANSLIGSRATLRLSFGAMVGGKPTNYIVRILNVRLNDDGRIALVRVIDDALRTRPNEYLANQILALVTDKVAFVRDEPTEILVTRGELEAREALKRKMAEIARLEREEQQRLARIRRLREEQESLPHIITREDGTRTPAPGYDWVGEDLADRRVRWSRGKEHPKFENIVASAVTGRWEPSPGYEFVKNAPDDMQAKWAPGASHKRFENIVASNKEGVWLPLIGFEFVNSVGVASNDLRVRRTPGTRHPTIAHIVASTKENVWTAEPGYVFSRSGDYATHPESETVRWAPKKKHPKFSDVVASPQEGSWIPSPGYDWVKGSDVTDMHVAWLPGARHPWSKNIGASTVEGQWRADPGYELVDNAPHTISARWSPGKVHAKFDNVIASSREGDWVAAPGYRFANATPGDLSVALAPRPTGVIGDQSDIQDRSNSETISSDDMKKIVVGGALLLGAAALLKAMQSDSGDSPMQGGEACGWCGGSGRFGGYTSGFRACDKCWGTGRK